MVLAAALPAARPRSSSRTRSRDSPTRCLARFVKAIFGAFKTRGKIVPEKEISAASAIRCASRVREALPSSAAARASGVLVVGGSQGAHAVNELVFAGDEAAQGASARRRACCTRPAEKDREDFARRYAEAEHRRRGARLHRRHGRRLSRRRRRRGARRRLDLAELTIDRQAGHPDPVSVRRRRSPDGQRAASSRDAGAAVPVAAGDRRRRPSWPRRSAGCSKTATPVAPWRPPSRALGRPRAHVEIADAIEALAR